MRRGVRGPAVPLPLDPRAPVEALVVERGERKPDVEIHGTHVGLAVSGIWRGGNEECGHEAANDDNVVSQVTESDGE